MSHKVPAIFTRLFHPHCIIVYFCSHVAIVLQDAYQIFEFGDLWKLGRLHFTMAFHSDTCTLALLLTLLDTFIPLFSKASLHCSSSNSSQSFSLVHSEHLIIRVHRLPRCFLSDVFRHDGKQERTESGSLVEGNIHCKEVACSSNTPRQSDVLLWHPLPLMYQYSSSLGTLSYAFSRSMNTHCKSCCTSLYLSCVCISTKMASVV